MNFNHSFFIFLQLATNLLGSQRLIVAALLGFCSLTFYAQRQSLFMGMFCMVDHNTIKNLSTTHHSHIAACRTPLSSPITDEEDNDITVQFC